MSGVPALETLRELTAILSRCGIEDAAKEAELLMTATVGIGKTALYGADILLDDDTIRTLASLTKRRIKGEPIQYLIGQVEFYGLRIFVGPGVLIPRPETELLVEEVIRLIKGQGAGDKGQPTAGGPPGANSKAQSEVGSHKPAIINPELKILDLCTGSGCIALSLAKGVPDAFVYGVDRSGTAIGFAVRNALDNGVTNAQFRAGDLFGPVEGMRFDCIVSNPPYIRKSDIPGLQREVREHEPQEALDGGEDGLDFYRRILGEAPDYLLPRGLIALELGHDQAAEVQAIASASGFTGVRFTKDYAGFMRIMTANKAGESPLV